ncbi:MAG TPA: alpha/beta fold hydrolase [Acidimicrobiales bacterium]|jgi:pimeloyl-ACP methyl ester carboxylesterase|nr:alpha/beta fold hydrolase [Acidimicrobiales bacterium]
MAHVCGEVVIERDRVEVFDFVADVRNEPRFNPRMTSCSLETDEPIGEGSRFRATLRLLGRRVPLMVELTAYRRPHRLASRSFAPGMRADGELRFERDGRRTRLSWSWEVRPSGSLRLLDPLVARLGDRQERRTWGSLKSLLEGRGSDIAVRPAGRAPSPSAASVVSRGIRRGRWPRTPAAEARPGSIAEAAYHRLGGRDQWVAIHGRDAANPPLLFLHGGPGWSETWLFRRFNAPLEDTYTAVYWDQRGAGRSYDRTVDRSSMTVEQLLADLDELVDRVRDRLGAPKVAIFGHSWGSALGVLYAARAPGKVSAYVGCGQIGDWPAAESASYRLALAEAKRRGRRRAEAKLRAIGPPPYGADAVFVERAWSLRLAGGLRPRTLWGIGRAVLGAEELSLAELPRAWRGFRFSMEAMWQEVSRLNLVELVPALDVPVFLLCGRHDPWVPATTSAAYFDAIRAPAKELVWFEHSGHEPFVDEPGRFNATMAGRVRRALVSAAPRRARPR